jgi:NIPSNAP
MLTAPDALPREDGSHQREVEMLTELRRYRVKPGRMPSWLKFFAEAAKGIEAGGARVEYAGVDRETGTFVWLRTFADEADRQARKADFYGGDWWGEREAFAMDHILEYEVTFLDTAIHRDGGSLTLLPWPPDGERPGGRGDGPPDGWTASTRRTFVPEESGAGG